MASDFVSHDCAAVGVDSEPVAAVFGFLMAVVSGSNGTSGVGQRVYLCSCSSARINLQQKHLLG